MLDATLGCPMGKYSDKSKVAAAEDYWKGNLGLKQVALSAYAIYRA